MLTGAKLLRAVFGISRNFLEFQVLTLACFHGFHWLHAWAGTARGDVATKESGARHGSEWRAGIIRTQGGQVSAHNFIS